MKAALRKFLLFLITFNSIGAAFAADKTSSAGAVRKAIVVNDSAAVYKSPDFDAPVLTYLKEGMSYLVSTQVFGPFLKIKVSEQMTGYIADTDVNTVKDSKKVIEKKEKAAKVLVKHEEESREASRKLKPFQWTRFSGLQLSSIRFREETMGLRPSENLTFYGLKMTGPDLLIEGEMVTEFNLQFHLDAPNYYETATGKPASGMLMLLDVMMLSQNPQGKNALLYFGFGPMIRYSKFDVSLGNIPYSLQDIAFGAKFNLGIGLRVSKLALRAETQLFWEKLIYSGIGVTAQMEF